MSDFDDMVELGSTALVICDSCNKHLEAKIEYEDLGNDIYIMVKPCAYCIKSEGTSDE